MFEHFTFGAQPQTHHHHHHHILDEDVFPSPKDTSFLSPLTQPPTSFPFPSSSNSPPPQPGISDIVAKFSQQSLGLQSQSQQQSQSQSQSQAQARRSQLLHHLYSWHGDGPELEVDDEDEDGDQDEEIDTDTPSSSPLSSERSLTKTASLPSTSTPTPVQQLPPSTLACRRLRRQLNVQLQSSPRHVRDIHALVEEMIVSGSQCRVRQCKSQSKSQSKFKSMPRAYLSSSPSELSSPSSGAVEGLIVDTSSELDDDDEEEEEEEEEEDSSLRVDVDDNDIDINIDEGFCDDETFSVDEEVEMEVEIRVSLRRASTPGGVRKHHYHGAVGAGAKYNRGYDVGDLAADSRCKVRSLPRMRRRNVSSVRE